MTTPSVALLDLGQELRGGQRQVLYLAQTLARTSDFFPLIICPRGSGLARAAGQAHLPVFLLPGRCLANPGLWLALRRALRSAPIRILHTHDANAASAGTLLRVFFPGLKLVHSRRVSYAPKSGPHLWKYLKADAVVGVSREIADMLIAAGLPPARVHTIHSGLEPETYAPKRPRAAGTPFRFLSVGAFSPQKGFAVLLEAAALLAADTTLPPWQVRIVGDGVLAAPLCQQAAALGLLEGNPPRVELPGRLESRAELPDADAVVVPSVDGEGSSATIKEAWVTGVPLIASDLTSNREMVKDGQNGLLTRAGKAESLAAAMRHVLTDAALAQKLVSGGNAALPGYTAERMAQAYLNLYKTL